MDHRLDWRKGKLWKGDVCLKADGELEAARELLKLGLVDIGDTLVGYRGDTPCFGGSVRWMAEHEVGMNSGGTPIFRKRRLSGGSRTGKRVGD